MATTRPDFNRYLGLARAPDRGAYTRHNIRIDAGTGNPAFVRGRGPVNITSHIVYGRLDNVQIGEFF